VVAEPTTVEWLDAGNNRGVMTYNEMRPHDALYGLTPATCRTQTQAELFTFNR
jgi:hypothetical protein